MNDLEVTDTPQSRQLYQVRNDSMVAAQPVSASTAGLFGPFLDQTLRMVLETNSCETDFKIKDFFIKP
jgi:hypothetical protein